MNACTLARPQVWVGHSFLHLKQTQIKQNRNLSRSSNRVVVVRSVEDVPLAQLPVLQETIGGAPIPQEGETQVGAGVLGLEEPRGGPASPWIWPAHYRL